MASRLCFQLLQPGQRLACVLLVVLLCFHISEGASLTANSVGTVAGTIKKTIDNTPINGALVEALQDGVVKGAATTATNGTYSIADLESGTYDIRVSASGYQTKSQNGVVVTTGNTTSFDQTLDVTVVSGDVDYIYDDLGRIVAVVTTQEVTNYNYDAVGNLLSVSKGSPSQVSVLQFTPTHGSVGTAVTILGTGFSATPSANSVSFNGAAATVTAATTTRLTTSVPSGATTGPISVTSPNGTASSSTSFVVHASTAPVITSFTPTIGSPGTTVTINGSNFQSDFYNNRVEFNSTLASISAATTTSITTTVPTNASSGHISVGTTEGTGVSSGDFYVVPSPLTATDVEVTSRMNIGESKVVTITQANKVALILFDGVAGQRVSVGMTGVTIGAPSCCDTAIFNLYKPSGVLISNFGFGPSGNGTTTQTLPVTGTYSMLVDPNSTYTGSVTLTLFEEVPAPITIDGSPVTLNFGGGQNGRLNFTGTAGQRVSVGLTGITISPGYCCDVGTVGIYVADGPVVLAPMTFTNGGAGTPSVVLPANGTYSIVIDPYQARSGAVTATLSSDLAPSITINGASVPLDLRAGQNTWLSFDGTAGQRVSVGLSAITIGTGYCCDIGTVALYKPDGTLLQAATTFTNQGAGTPSAVLPVSGTYRILIDPYIGRSGAVTATLSADLSPSISINGGGVPLDFRPGQNAWLTFDGTAGQRVSVGLSGITISPGYCCDVGTVTLYKPDGTTLQSAMTFTNQGAGTPSVALPVSGTYSILIDPYLARSGAATVTLSADLTPSITINGSAVVLDLNAGQNAWLSFDGTAGQRVSVGLSAISIAPGYCCDVGTVSLYKPDGTVLQAAIAFTNQGAGTPSVVLPVSGTYKILIDPYLGRSGSVTATLSADLSPAISINGGGVALDFRAGQNAWLTFGGTAGQRVSVGLSGITIGTGYCCDVGTITLYKPDGTVLQSAVTFTNQGNGTPSVVLPVSGTYSILIDPYLARSGAATATLSGDLSPSITINGSAVVLDFNAGQNAWLPFDGTAGQRVSVGLSGITVGTGYCCDVGTVTLYKPDGTVLQSATTFTNQGAGTASVVLPVSGTYRILIDPYLARSGSITATLSADLSPTITINGSSVVLDFNAGQNAWLPFDGTAGQRVSVGLSGITIGTGYCCDIGTVTLYKPDGTVLQSATTFTNQGTGTATVVLPVSGTYRILIDPYLARTGSITATVSADLSPALSINGDPVTLDFRPGQNSLMSFDGTAGQRISVGLSGSTIAPGYCCDIGNVTLFKPDGTVLQAAVNFTNNGVGTATVILPVTGTYTIAVNPMLARSGAITLTLSADLAPSITPNGGSVLLTFRSGQNALPSFAGTASQQITVRITGNTLGTVTVKLLKPDGTQLTSASSSASSFNLSTQTLPVTGTYTISIDPSGPAAGSLSVAVEF